jgi:hypothetical protein
VELEYWSVCGDLSASYAVWVSFDVAGSAESGVDDFLVVDRGRGKGFLLSLHWEDGFYEGVWRDEGRWFR